MEMDAHIGHLAAPLPKGDQKLVDFIVIGTMRAGTTLLHDILARHPQISMARMKETDYFIAEKNYPRGNDWYVSQFDVEKPL
ncbi:sulfotransferase [Paracoccus laeviglucosivorans]|uniref:Sulfotransferase family protein n=1 Tax=Paracoccus laeviglucosivorans TaxID=1197861 RepID=A0A521F558_9RHOB|nr:sulfotransferase [Paracoccus laeviglucosivorans]SMO91284.1 Sulfotransferase family protein [Paracoccus laeviglucosivorans]